VKAKDHQEKYLKILFVTINFDKKIHLKIIDKTFKKMY